MNRRPNRDFFNGPVGPSQVRSGLSWDMDPRFVRKSDMPNRRIQATTSAHSGDGHCLTPIRARKSSNPLILRMLLVNFDADGFAFRTSMIMGA
jgi:hypothetical protein